MMSRPRRTAPCGTPASARAFSAVLDPKTGKHEQIPLGPGPAPHGVIVGAGRRRLDHRRRAERDRALRSDDQEREAVPLPQELPERQPQHRRLRQGRQLWFTGQNGVYGRVDPETGKIEAWKSPQGRGPYGIAATPSGDVWYVSLAGDYHRAGSTPRPAPRGRRAADAGRRARAASGRTPRACCGSASGTAGELGRYDPAAKTWKTYPLPKSRSRLLLGLCRRQGPGLGHRLARQRDPAVRSGDREVRDLPERQARRQCAPDARPAGRGLGRRSGNDRLVVLRD